MAGWYPVLNLLVALVELLGGRLHLWPQGGRIHQYRQIADKQAVDRGADRVLQVWNRVPGAHSDHGRSIEIELLGFPV